MTVGTKENLLAEKMAVVMAEKMVEKMVGKMGGKMAVVLDDKRAALMVVEKDLSLVE
jgi:hypothetical protein